MFVCFCFASASSFEYRKGDVQGDILSSTTKVAVGDGDNTPLPLLKEERKTQKGSESVKGAVKLETGNLENSFSDAV